MRENCYEAEGPDHPVRCGPEVPGSRVCQCRELAEHLFPKDGGEHRHCGDPHRTGRGLLAGTGPVTRYWRRKYDDLRGLYRYAVSRGWADHVPLPATVPKMPERLVPHVFHTDDPQRLIHHPSPEPCGGRKLHPHTLRAVLLLLYGAGLRIGET